MKEEKDENEIEEGESFVCKILNYKIYADRYQYIVRYFDPQSKTKTKGTKKDYGKLMGYHRSLADALQDIRENELRLSVLDARSLDNAVNRLIEADTSFKKLLVPLKKFENI